jgi:outer membrane murein-binding lipoprotein Lpp
MDPNVWEPLGTTALLMAVLITLAKFTQGIVTRILADKDKQIEQLSASVDKLTNEIGATLSDVLNAIKDQASEAEDRRRSK